MRTLAYCFSCNKEHDITEIGVENKGLKCDCGGYIISPSGKINMKLLPQNDEDKKLLGIELEKANIESIKKPLPKVFRMDEYSWVCAMDEESAIDWYIKESGISEEDLDIRECDVNKETMYSEISLSDITEILEKAENGDDINLDINKKYGSYFIKETFKEAIENMIKKSSYESVIKKPFEICTTEW